MRSHVPGHFDGNAILLRATRVDPELRAALGAPSWHPRIAGSVEAHDVDTDHEGPLTEPAAVRAIGTVLAHCL
ncbi:hypothetical protein P3102_34200 [Amycolatopsis sp. QT-25]|uniref:hypothetical protein n=1 Tax=Amycolatopsis sp. QT-25 TaxID=3034022 RepID=UPI0023EE0323|nr:hypothetical protein [Amycolatopsis sp. QT-25]WET79029.1 hypothetical protein P3102_34200 [Amycolatopsis sp. QT-25]